MQYAIYHTATRVVRRLTVDSSPPMLPDEGIIEVSDAWSFAPNGRGWYKVGADGRRLNATAQERDDAGLDDEAISLRKNTARAAAVTALKTIAAGDPRALQDWAIAMLKIEDPLGR